MNKLIPTHPHENENLTVSNRTPPPLSISATVPNETVALVSTCRKINNWTDEVADLLTNRWRMLNLRHPVRDDQYGNSV